VLITQIKTVRLGGGVSWTGEGGNVRGGEKGGGRIVMVWRGRVDTVLMAQKRCLTKKRRRLEGCIGKKPLQKGQIEGLQGARGNRRGPRKACKFPCEKKLTKKKGKGLFKSYG